MPSAGKSRTHAGKEIQIGESFELDGRRWLIPSVYVCPEGIVIDMISQTEMSIFNDFYNRYRSEIEGGENLPDDKFDLIKSENPVITDVRAKLTVNGKSAKPKGMSGIIWIPEIKDTFCDYTAIMLCKKETYIPYILPCLRKLQTSFLKHGSIYVQAPVRVFKRNAIDIISISDGIECARDIIIYRDNPIGKLIERAAHGEFRNHFRR